MKSTKKVLDTLNSLLADELTAISQYMVQAEMCENWGYGKLHKAIKHQAKDEMHHAEWLVSRILFLEGRPVMSKLNPIKISQTAADMLKNAEDSEQSAVAAYNRAIALARESHDEGTARVLWHILKMEEGHMDWAERQRLQVEQLGLQNYLARQTRGASAR
jgi:bacterioferritin